MRPLENILHLLIRIQRTSGAGSVEINHPTYSGTTYCLKLGDDFSEEHVRLVEERGKEGSAVGRRIDKLQKFLHITGHGGVTVV